MTALRPVEQMKNIRDIPFIVLQQKGKEEEKVRTGTGSIDGVNDNPAVSCD